MNTYDINVKGKKIYQKVKFEDLEGKLKNIRGLVWMSGGKDEDIEIVENTFIP